MRRCSGFGALVPLSAILPRTSSHPTLFPASSLDLPLAHLADSFTTPPCDVSSPLRTSRPPPVDPLPPQGATKGAASGGAVSRGAEPASADPGGAEPEGAESGGAGATSPGGACTRGTGAAGAGGVGGTGAGGAGAGGSGARDIGAGGAGARGPRDRDPGAGGASARGAGAGDPGAGGAGAGGAGAGVTGAGCTDAHGAGAGGARVGNTLTERRGPKSRPASPVSAVRTGRRVPCPRPPPVTGTLVMALRPSSVPLRVPLPPPPVSSLPAIPDTESDLACADSPTFSRLLATVVTDHSFESTVASALVVEVVEFAAACRFDYATSLIAESESDCPPSVGGAGAGGAGAVAPGGTVRPRPYFVPLLQQVLGTPPSAALTPPLLCPPPDQSQLPLQPASPLLAPSPYTEQSGGLTEQREPASRPVSSVRTARCVPRSRLLPVLGTHAMTLRPSSVPLRVPLLAPPESSLPKVPHPESDCARAASPTVSRLLATAVTDPSFESAVASALVAELVDFAAACRLDYATTIVAESAPASPPSVGGECALGTDVLEDRQEDFECLAAAVPHLVAMLLAPEGDPDAPDIPTPCSYAEAITGRYSSQWQTAMDAVMASWNSTGTYIDAVPPPGANIVDGMWIFKVKRPPGSPLVFKARYIARGFSQRQGHSFLIGQPARGDLAAPPTWLHWVVSCRYPVEPLTASLRSPPGASRVARNTEDNACGSWVCSFDCSPVAVSTHRHSLPPFYVLVYVDDLVFSTADTEALVLQRFSFRYSLPQSTPLPTGHSLSAPPSNESVEPSGPYPELVGCLITSGMGLVLGGRGPVVLTGHADASWVDDLVTQRSAIAAQELRWLTYLLTDLGERPRTSPVLYVDNKVMNALCQEHRLEHRTKHIALRYFLARELQQRGQLHLAYVATRANTADIFIKALQSGDHQRFCTILGPVPTLPHLLTM
ncbi:unnamed protein product [Closterium sp. NIES-53]